MEKPVFFTVVVPTYNRAHMIAQTLQSALLQDYSEYEINVVDDGSTDNTAEVIAALNNPKINYLPKKNEERAVARNYGTNHSKGDYICFLDSDDFFYPHHLKTANEFIHQHNFPEIFHLNYDFVDVDKNVLKRGPAFSEPDAINKIIIKGNPLSADGVFLRRDIALKYQFNPDIKLSASEDYELWLRLASRFIIQYSNTITSSVLSHDERSVVTLSKEKMIVRINKLIHYATNDVLNKKIYGSQFSVFASQCLLYLALHLAIIKEKSASVKYLLKAIKVRPKAMLDRRFFGTLKTLLMH